MRPWKAFLTFFLLLLPGFSLAESSWDLTTDSRIERVVWPASYDEDTNKTLLRLELIPRWRLKSTEAWQFYFKPSFLWDPQNKSREEQVFFDIGETYLKYKGTSSSLQAGSHILNWGVTDGYNPLDVVNSRQYYDPLHSVKLGAPSLLFSQNTSDSELELIYIPQNQSSLLPGTQSRWLPRKVYIPQSVDNNITLLLPENLQYSYESRRTLNSALDHNLGFRWQRHLSSIDLSLSGFEGLAPFPLVQAKVSGTVLALAPKIILQTDPQVVLASKNYRQRGLGFSWVSSQMNFLFKYATQYSQSLGDDPLLPGWSHENVLALEKNFNIANKGLLVGILQHSFIFTEKENDSNFSVNNIFRRAWMLGGRFSWDESWTLTALGLYDSLRYGSFQQYALAWRLKDVWTLQFSAEMIAGNTDTPLGVYSDNDNYRLSLSRSF